MKNFKLELLREYMKEMALSAFIVPSNDPHFGEYIQDHFNCRAWISGFTGSAGTVVVTHKEAALWTDSRYFIQAERELEGTGIELKKLRMPGTETVEAWLQTKLEANQSVGIDSSLFSVSEYNTLKISLNSLNIQLCNDPFMKIWDDRPLLKFGKIDVLGEEISGESTSSKHRRFVNNLELHGNFIYLVSQCDDIAWLCNIRGNDIPYNPLVLSYAAVTRDKIYLFVNPGAIQIQERRMLEKEGVVIMPYDTFSSFLSDFPADSVRIAHPDKVSIKNYNSAVKGGARFFLLQSRGGVITMMKAVKNSVEAEGFRKAMQLDGIAWVKTLIHIEESIKNGEEITEESVSEVMQRFRAESPEYRGESFHPIVAYGANAAMPHYAPSGEPVVIGKAGFLLVDTGGHYSCGTTDSTRTLPVGPLTDEQRRDYTLILRGMIALSMARFPKGTRGSQLDFLARGPICSVAKLYLHGTGHGIGHYLCVHEGPQSIRMEENPVVIEPGMVMSNEPAVYQEGEYGIRIENTIMCTSWMESRWGDFYKFETLTYIPIETSPVDKRYLPSDSLEWLNEYNAEVYNRLSPYLSESERKWLFAKTARLD
jgi:Xaa-Pro aminopeptidase